MKTTTLKAIPDGLYSELKRRARAARRSLNAEILYRLERSVQEREYTAAELLARIDRVRERANVRYASVEELNVAIDEGHE